MVTERAIVIEPQRNGVLIAVRRAHPHHVIPGRAELQGLQLLESCSFRWIFDATTHRFRRTPRDAGVWLDSHEAWTEYHRLEIDEWRSCFVVGLDEGGTRILRAWLHAEPCDRCGRDGGTTGDLQVRIRAWKERLRVREPRWTPDRESRPRALRPFGGWARPEGAR